MIETQPNSAENTAAPSHKAISDPAMLMPTFHFAGYTLRPALESDLPRAAWWNDADEDHREVTKPAFWIEQTEQANSFVLEEGGRPVFFFKLVAESERVACVHIQFSPDETPRGRLRSMNGLTIGFGWLKKRLTSIGFETVYFNSKRQSLILFCQKRMGFEWDGKRLLLKLKEVSDGGKIHPESDSTHEGEGNTGQLRQGDA